MPISPRIKDKITRRVIELLDRDSNGDLFDESDRVRPGYSRFQKILKDTGAFLRNSYARRDEEWGPNKPFTEWFFRFEDHTPDIRGRPNIKKYCAWVYPKKCLKNPGPKYIDCGSHYLNIEKDLNLIVRD